MILVHVIQSHLAWYIFFGFNELCMPLWIYFIYRIMHTEYATICICSYMLQHRHLIHDLHMFWSTLLHEQWSIHTFVWCRVYYAHSCIYQSAFHAVYIQLEKLANLKYQTMDCTWPYNIKSNFIFQNVNVSCTFRKRWNNGEFTQCMVQSNYSGSFCRFC